MEPASPRRIRNFLASLRFRIAIIYSSILFGLSALVTGALYLLIANNLEDEDSVQPVFSIFGQGQDLSSIENIERLNLANRARVERLANEQAIETLRDYSLIALGILFVASFIVGWLVAGNTLRPIRRITSVIQEIYSSQDLSLRVQHSGPKDELKDLSDTFDNMLADLEKSFRENILTLEATLNFVKESSHEIRNPLQIIRTNLQITQGNKDATLEDYQETIKVVTTAIDRMSNVVDDLTQSEYYRFLQKEHSILDLSELLQELNEEFGRMAISKGIELKENSNSVEILGDRLSCKQAIANLITNSIEALEGSTQSPYILMSSEKQGGLAVVKIEDNGPGILPEDQSRIFVRNERGSDGEEEGRGLGLTIVSQIIESHGGEVGVFSEPGVKTIFSVELPAAL